MLPMKQDWFDERDNIPTGVVPSTDNGNVDCLGGKTTTKNEGGTILSFPIYKTK